MLFLSFSLSFSNLHQIVSAKDLCVQPSIYDSRTLLPTQLEMRTTAPFVTQLVEHGIRLDGDHFLRKLSSSNISSFVDCLHFFLPIGDSDYLYRVKFMLYTGTWT